MSRNQKVHHILMKKKAIIIGATSGIGQEVAKILSAHEYIVGITGRRINLLEELKEEIPSKVVIKSIDVTNTEAVDDLQCLINEMQGIDLIVICAGVGFIDPELPWNKERETIETNVIGFTAMANVAFHHFIQKKQGHLVGISSIAAIRGGDAPAYNASKAFVSNYLQGLRYIASKDNNDITILRLQTFNQDLLIQQWLKVKGCFGWLLQKKQPLKYTKQ